MIKLLETFRDYWFIEVSLMIVIIILLVIYYKLKTNNVKSITEVSEPTEKAEPKSELEVVLKAMEENVNNRKAISFEQEQEENAIISYQELLEAAKGRREASIEVADPERQELIDLIEQQPELEISQLDVNPDDIIETIMPAEEPKKFKTSDFISPIFGKDEPVTSESNDDFLAALKSFRSNL